MSIDLSPLHNAIARLGEGWDRYAADPTDLQIRDGLIQRFEFTFDLAPKFLRRVLETTTDTPEQVDQLTFPDLIRTGFEKGLLSESLELWRKFREMRNITSQTYNEAKAIEVVEMIPGFLNEVRALAARLERAL